MNTGYAWRANISYAGKDSKPHEKAIIAVTREDSLASLREFLDVYSEDNALTSAQIIDALPLGSARYFDVVAYDKLLKARRDREKKEKRG